MRELLLGTGNVHKAKELAALLSGLDITFRTLRDFPGIGEVDEDGGTLEANAVKKALAYARGSGLWALADDTGLEVEALGGRPGVYSARYAGPACDFEANNRKLLGELMERPAAERGARFRCVLALASPSGEVTVEEGSVEGRIAESIIGGEGFGYDPLFYLPEMRKTLAELSFEEKNTLSHRAAAAARMRPHLAALPAGGPKSCPRCNLELNAWHCRMVCPGCGYQEDCSDVGLP